MPALFPDFVLENSRGQGPALRDCDIQHPSHAASSPATIDTSPGIVLVCATRRSWRDTIDEDFAKDLSPSAVVRSPCAARSHLAGQLHRLGCKNHSTGPQIRGCARRQSGGGLRTRSIGGLSRAASKKG